MIQPLPMRCPFYLFCLAIMFGSVATTVVEAQHRELDSLQNLVRNLPADTTQVWLLNRIVASLRETDHVKAMELAQRARDLSELLHYDKGKYIALENMGWIYYRRGDYTKGLELSSEALNLAEKAGDQAAIARGFNNMGAIRFEQKQFKLAISMFRAAHDMAMAVHDLPVAARSLNNVAHAYLATHQPDSAAYWARLSASEAEAGHDRFQQGFAKRVMGDVSLQRGKHAEALALFQECLAIARRIDNVFLETSTLHRIAGVYKSLNQPDKALPYLNYNIMLATRGGYKDELERSYKMLSEIYFQKQDLEKAYAYQAKYVAIHDSLYDQRSGEQRALLEARFNTEMKEAQIALLTKDTQLKQEEINNQRVWMYFYIGIITLLGILAFLLIYNDRIRQGINRNLEQRNQEVQQQAHQLSNLNKTKDKLFSIISHDLRSPLASLRGLIDLVVREDLSREEFAQVSKKLQRNLDSVNEDLDNLLFWAQSQLKGLQVHPQAVCVRQVVEEKIDLFKEYALNKGVSIQNDVDDDIYVTSDKNHLGLVVRNLLANAIKFNRRGGIIVVRHQSTDDQVEISVIDSGVGMDSRDLGRLFNAETHFTNPGTNQEKGTGIGLLLTKEFIEKNGGAIWVTSELGKGSTFTFRLRRDFVAASAKVVV